jgi:RNA polymerase sigma-70 factor (ECF subfamily)
LDEERKTEDAIREAFDAGDLARTATQTLEQYGPEVLGLLVALHRDRDEASDAFSVFSERLWASLPKFEWRCSMRTWVYMIARRVSHDVRRGEGRRAHRNVPLSSVVSRVAVQVRTRTLTMLRTETKTAIMKLRASLPEDDQTLLVLRVDRQLEWNELARVFLDVDGKEDEADPDVLKREAARLRKRFQLVKERLLAMGREQGLVKR